MSTDARTAILERIRSALVEGAPGPHGPDATHGGPAANGSAPSSLAMQRESLPGDYQRNSQLSAEARLDLLEDRLRDYDADVTRVADGDVATTIAAVLAGRGNRPTLVPPGFPAQWLPEAPRVVPDTGFSPHELDRFDGVLTGAVAAIADTGSLVLQNVPGQGRRSATLVPDFHLCVVRAQDVVQTVPEVFERLAVTATLPTTFVSGPSATADIEMTRIKGVHGPRFLHVLLVMGETPATDG